MIGSLRGTVLERAEDATVLLEVAGVGYLVTVTPRTLAELEPGSTAFLHIHHHIREDAQTLYGFLQRDERLTFNVLIATHGVGPAMAMAMLATHSPTLLNEFNDQPDHVFIMEPGQETLPVRLDQHQNPEWLRNFALGDLYMNQTIAPQVQPKT